MNDKSIRDQIWEKKRQEREERIRLQRDGHPGEHDFDPSRGKQLQSLPQQPKQQYSAHEQVHSPQLYSQQRMEQIRKSNGTEPSQQGNAQPFHFVAPNQPVRVSPPQFLAGQEITSSQKQQQFQQQQQQQQHPLAFTKQQSTQDQGYRNNSISSEKSIQLPSESSSDASGGLMRSIDQRTKSMQQQYNNNSIQQKQMADQQRKKAEELSQYEEDRRRKDNYRRALQDQMKEKEEQAAHAKHISALNQSIGSSTMITPQQESIGIELMQAVAAQQTKQELADYLRFQMAQKNQQPPPDKKTILQQQMETINSSPQQTIQQQRKVPIVGQNNQPDTIAYLQGQQQQQLYAYQQQMQQMPIQSPQSAKYPHNKVNTNGSIVSGVRNMPEYSSPNVAHRVYAQQTPSAAAAASSSNSASVPGTRAGNYEEARAYMQANSSISNSQQNGNVTPNNVVGIHDRINLVRGNKNFIKVENADLNQVNRKQQQQQEYQKDLQRQIEEKARAKREEADKIRREEYMEEQRLLKEQEMLRRQLEDETNPKQPGTEDTSNPPNEFLQQEPEEPQSKKIPRKKNISNNLVPPSRILDNGAAAISMASKDFLDEEKKNEGIDQHSSIVDFYRKKETSKQGGNQNNIPQQQQIPPPNMNMLPIMYQQQQQQVPANGMNGMNPMMMGMMNPMMMQQQHQQQQMLANQQAQLIQPQLNELRMQMQQQQQMMQQQIDLIKNQANLAIEEKKTAESKYNEIKKQYELKQLEEERYTAQLNQALAKTYDPSPKSTPSAPQFNYHQNPNDQKQQMPYRRTNIPSSLQQDESDYHGRRASPSPPNKPMNTPQTRNSQHEQKIVQFSDDSNKSPSKKPTNHSQQQRTPSDDFINANANTNHKRPDSNMEIQARKSLASDNKFIPLDILDDLKRKEQNVTLSKLGNYGVTESQLHQYPSNQQQQYNHAAYPQPNSTTAYPKRPPTSFNSSNNEGGNQWNIPSVNSDITKEIDGLLQRNLNRYAPNEKQSHNPNDQNGIYSSQQQSSYNTSTIENFHPNHEKDPNHGQVRTPLTRIGSSQQMRRTNRDQPFGAAARGILGDSRAFEQQQQRQSNMGTFKTNGDHEGYKLGNDFPDFTMNGTKNNGFGLVQKERSKQFEQNSSVGNLKGLGNTVQKVFNNTSGLTTKNQATLNTNNFDIDMINKRNDERLSKLDKFGLQTLNAQDDNPSTVEKEEEGLDKLEFLLQKFNANNNIK